MRSGGGRGCVMQPLTLANRVIELGFEPSSLTTGAQASSQCITFSQLYYAAPHKVAIFVDQTRLNISSMSQPDLFPNCVIQVSLVSAVILSEAGPEEWRIHHCLESLYSLKNAYPYFCS